MTVVNFPKLGRATELYVAYTILYDVVDARGDFVREDSLDIPLLDIVSPWQEILAAGHSGLSEKRTPEDIVAAILELDVTTPQIHQVDLLLPTKTEPWHTILCTAYGDDKQVTPLELGETDALSDWAVREGGFRKNRITACPYLRELHDILDWYRGYHQGLANFATEGETIDSEN